MLYNQAYYQSNITHSLLQNAKFYDIKKIERIKKYFYFQRNLGDSCEYNSNLSLGGS